MNIDIEDRLYEDLQDKASRVTERFVNRMSFPDTSIEQPVLEWEKARGSTCFEDLLTEPLREERELLNDWLTATLEKELNSQGVSLGPCVDKGDWYPAPSLMQGEPPHALIGFSEEDEQNAEGTVPSAATVYGFKSGQGWETGPVRRFSLGFLCPMTTPTAYQRVIPVEDVLFSSAFNRSGIIPGEKFSLFDHLIVQILELADAVTADLPAEDGWFFGCRWLEGAEPYVGLYKEKKDGGVHVKCFTLGKGFIYGWRMT